MKIIKKCFTCWFDNEYYSQEIYAENAQQAKYKYTQLGFDAAKYTQVKCKRYPSLDIVELNGKEGKLSDLQREIERENWRNLLRTMQATNPTANVLIYSGEHAKYWLANRSGYTSKKQNAGVYAIQDAINSVYHCGIEKQIELVIT